MANPSLFYCLRFVFRTFLLNFQGCHCSIIKVHLFVCAVRCSRRLCYFSTSLCACQVLFYFLFKRIFAIRFAACFRHFFRCHIPVYFQSFQITLYRKFCLLHPQVPGRCRRGRLIHGQGDRSKSVHPGVLRGDV